MAAPHREIEIKKYGQKQHEMSSQTPFTRRTQWHIGWRQSKIFVSLQLCPMITLSASSWRKLGMWGSTDKILSWFFTTQKERRRKFLCNPHRGQWKGIVFSLFLDPWLFRVDWEFPKGLKQRRSKKRGSRKCSDNSLLNLTLSRFFLDCTNHILLIKMTS